jgi:hypothetical protein
MEIKWSDDDDDDKIHPVGPKLSCAGTVHRNR